MCIKSCRTAFSVIDNCGSPLSRIGGAQQNRKSHTNKMMFINGASGEIGPGLVERAILDDYRVLACCRTLKGRLKLLDNKNYDRLRVVVFDEELSTHSNFYYDLIKQECLRNINTTLFVNMIGGAETSDVEVLKKYNARPVLAAQKALEDLSIENRSHYFKLVHISSIAASILGKNHPYSRVRLETDNTLMERSDNVTCTVFRPGLIYNEMIGSVVNLRHAYSPDQMATLPFHPVFGNGQQRLQPIYTQDLYEAITHAIDCKESEIVQAVGVEVLTFIEIMCFFTSLKGGKFRPLSIEYDLGHTMAKYFPKGRLAPYAVAMFESLEKNENITFSPKRFQELVGRPLFRMEEVYQNDINDVIYFFRPPVREHFLEIVKKSYVDPEARRHLVKAILKHSRPILRDVMKGGSFPED